MKKVEIDQFLNLQQKRDPEPNLFKGFLETQLKILLNTSEGRDDFVEGNLRIAAIHSTKGDLAYEVLMALDGGRETYNRL